jgi:hypothetical protein
MAVIQPVVLTQTIANRKGTMSLQTSRPPALSRIFPPRRDFASLSIKDLLDAREAYHVHLSILNNVVATAIGRYCIHEDDWYAQNPPDRPRPKNVRKVKEARTLANSVIRPWSWPSVLVFVKKWGGERELGEERVPKTLYLSDGRLVPTCVIEAAPDEELPPPAQGPFHASPLLGGGYACLRSHQGEQSLGTIACLVKKAGAYYALTNRHVAGGDGEIVKAFIRGQYQPIGTTSSIAVDRQSMSAVFPSWPGLHALLTLDAGLIKIEDINDWTSQAFGIGEIGEVFDATEQSVTLDLIGCPVRAFGGSTGVTEGEIRGLFFRYETVGGMDHATDVLIGPRRKDDHARIKNPPIEYPVTHPGDSGTLWFYDPPKNSSGANTDTDFENAQAFVEQGVRARRLRPIAMQWGGQRMVFPDGTKGAYALGTFLSTVCQALDVEVMRDWSLGHDEYWGKIGHYAIGWKACEQLSGAIRDVIKPNQERIGFGDDTLKEGSGFKVGRAGFVPLADVPDYVWIPQGMKKSGPRQFEAIQHFADIDIQDIAGGESLLERCAKDSGEIAASKWKAYFDGFAQAGVGPDRGALPFRVWQIWEAMVEYLSNKDVLRFVAAAGVLAHYVGDASQPLHCSYMHHGVPPMLTRNGRKYPIPKRLPGEKQDTDEYKAFKKTKPAQIHGIYEETMLEVDPSDVLGRVDEAIATLGPLKETIETGHDAATQVIQLMSRAQDRLAPKEIIDADDQDLKPQARATALWNNKKISDATAESLADSVRVLAALWEAAWAKGGGTQAIADANSKPIDEKKLDKVYRREPTFVPSLDLDAMAASGKFEPPTQVKPQSKRRAGRLARKPRVKPAATQRRKRRGE